MLNRSLGILTVLAALCVQAACAQTVSYIYVQTTKGVKLYDASASGKLTLVSGSPFKATGLMIGSNERQFITLGTDYVHSYALGSNGAIKGQLSQIDTQSYAGAECGTTSGAVFDRTGDDLYVYLTGTQNHELNNLCAAFQSYKIASSGALTFLGTVEPYNGGEEGTENPYFDLPVMSGGNQYAYALVEGLSGTCGEPEFKAFRRESSGALALAANQNFEYPTPEPGGWKFFPYHASTNAGDHMAVVMVPELDPPCGTRGSAQLASFTINSNGSIASTNTWENMPKPTNTPDGGIVLGPVSPSNTIVPVAVGQGIQFFHLNGGAPMTQMTAVIPAGGLITAMSWDHSGHLYGLDGTNGELHVYTVTSTKAVEAPGSPYSTGTPYYAGVGGLSVVAK